MNAEQQFGERRSLRPHPNLVEPNKNLAAPNGAPEWVKMILVRKIVGGNRHMI